MNRREKTLLFAVCALIGILFLSLLAYAPYTSQNPVFMVGTQINPYTYTIWPEGSTYYSRNSSNGEVYSSTNISALFGNAVGSGNVSVFFKAGEYFFDSMVYLPSNTFVTGEKHAVYLMSTFTSGAIWRSVGFVGGNEIISTAQENITVENLKFNGNRSNGAQLGFEVSNVTDVTVDSCVFDNFQDYGLKIWWSYGVKVLNNEVMNVPNGDGIHVVYCVNVRITGNRVYDIWDSCIGYPYNSNGTIANNVLSKTSTTINPTLNGQVIDVSGSNHTSIFGNEIDATRAYNGIAVLTFGTVHSHDITISLNIIQNSGYHGIDCEGTIAGTSDEQYHVSITSNTILNSGRFGIYLLRTGYSKISLNTIEGSSASANNTYDAIQIDSGAGDNNSTRNTIQSNTVYDRGGNASRYGILLTAGANYGITSSNLVKDSWTGGIQDNGLGNAVVGNMIDDVWTP